MPRETLRTVLGVVKAATRMPDGTPMPASLSHALLVLASYWPHIWPGQERLAADMCVSRRQLNRRLRLLEDAGLIVRHRRGTLSTAYQLDLKRLRLCDAHVTSLCDADDRFAVSPTSQEYRMKDEDEDLPF